MKEKFKENKKLILITTAACLLPLMFGMLVYADLPDSIAVHWDAAGNPNGYAPKLAGVFGLPLFLAAVHLFCIFCTLSDPKQRNQTPAARLLAFWSVPAVSVVAESAMILIALGVNIDMMTAIMLLVGVLFVAVGFALPRVRQNYTIGVKTPWTLHDEDNWSRTHRFGGFVFVISGILMFACGFLPISAETRTVVLVAAIAAIALLPIGYSFLLYLRNAKQD